MLEDVIATFPLVETLAWRFVLEDLLLVSPYLYFVVLLLFVCVVARVNACFSSIVRFYLKHTFVVLFCIHVLIKFLVQYKL